MFSVIIVDYKTADRTVQFIEELLQHSKNSGRLNFIIVDNSDNQETFEYINNTYRLGDELIFKGFHGEIFPFYQFEKETYTITFLKTNQNLGYAKGNNAGALLAKELFSDPYLVFTNNDLYVIGEIFDWQIFIDAFKMYPSCAMMGPQIIDKEKNEQRNPKKKTSWLIELVLYYYNILTKGILFNKQCQFVDFSPKTKSCDALVGCFVIADSEKFFKVGMYDENTFLYYEELILGERVQEQGYISLFLYDDRGKLLHEHGKTTKKYLMSIRGELISWQSRKYYFKKYRKLNLFVLRMTEVHFYIVVVPLLKVKNYIKFILVNCKMNLNR